MARAKRLDAMLAHQDCGVRVVHDVSAKIRILRECFIGDEGMPFGRLKHGKRWGTEKRVCKETPCGANGPRPLQGPGMCHDTEKLVEDWPRRGPRRR